ncbi:MAG: peptide chain release factor N(5)-glutamine methyltransferase [Bdellovibrionales bacterium]
MPSLAELRPKVATFLRNAGVDDAARETSYLLSIALNASRADLLVDRDLSAMEEAKINMLAARRAAGEPLDRIRGTREFYGLNFGLNEATLSPRADTEALVELVLEEAPENARLLDLGTGTGCILLTLLHNMRDARGTGVDISDKALVQAQQNARGLEIDADFIQSDWFENVSGTFDVIVSNPPYVRTQDIGALQTEVRDHDPHAALDGGADGLDAYKTIFANAQKFLNDGGMVAVEIGQGQTDDVVKIASDNGFILRTQKADLAGINRALLFGF